MLRNFVKRQARTISKSLKSCKYIGNELEIVYDSSLNKSCNLHLFQCAISDPPEQSF